MAKLLHLLAVLGLKYLGIKKTFSQDPIDYQKLRRGDQRTPPKRFYRKFNVKARSILDSKVFEVQPKQAHKAQKLVICIPGGAFVSGPAPHHWDALEKIIPACQSAVWLIDYPKAPESNIQEICKNMDQIYQSATEQFAPSQIILMGDSAGGNLILSLVQRLIKKNQALPKRLILITPVFESSFENPEIDQIDSQDPMLSKQGVVSAKSMVSNGLDDRDPMLSPIYGDFEGFPACTLFLGGRDILYPDALLGANKMKKAGVDLELIDNPAMFHIFPLLPIITEAKGARQKIIQQIKDNA